MFVVVNVCEDELSILTNLVKVLSDYIYNKLSPLEFLIKKVLSLEFICFTFSTLLKYGLTVIWFYKSLVLNCNG